VFDKELEEQKKKLKGISIYGIKIFFILIFDFLMSILKKKEIKKLVVTNDNE